MVQKTASVMASVGRDARGLGRWDELDGGTNDAGRHKPKCNVKWDKSRTSGLEAGPPGMQWKRPGIRMKGQYDGDGCLTGLAGAVSVRQVLRHLRPQCPGHSHDQAFACGKEGKSRRFYSSKQMVVWPVSNHFHISRNQRVCEGLQRELDTIKYKGARAGGWVSAHPQKRTRELDMILCTTRSLAEATTAHSALKTCETGREHLSSSVAVVVAKR